MVDIQSARFYSVALCSNESPHTAIIIDFWCRTCNIDVPDAVKSIFKVYHKVHQVFSTGQAGNGGNGHNHNVPEWTEIELRNKHIIKIRVGYQHTFLDSAGCVWCCGYNSSGQLGLGHEDDIYEIQCIDFFVKNNIKIQEIECGNYFSVMMDYDGRIWAFGDNDRGQICDGGGL